MIKTIKGNVLDIEEGIIVHCCNAQGVMGSGIAKEIKQRYPQAFSNYKDHIDRYKETNRSPLGTLSFYRVNDKKCVINAIVQEFYGRDKNMVYVDYDSIRQCLKGVNFYAPLIGISLPVCFPLIGCWLAGGDWGIVSSIIEEEIDSSIDKHLYIL